MSKKRVILIEVDSSCHMAAVSLDDKLIMEGNFHDFHPDCHGIHQYGDFRGYQSLVARVYKKLIKEEKVDYKDISTVRKNYDWHNRQQLLKLADSNQET